MKTARIVALLRKRQARVLPKDWREGRDCPECGSTADRPKCLMEAANCPRLDPNNYDPPPWKVEPDPLCVAAADALERLTVERDLLRQTLDDSTDPLARAMVQEALGRSLGKGEERG